MTESGGTGDGGTTGGIGGTATGLRFRMLGPVEGDLGGRPLRLGPPQQRALLAVLLLRAGRPVSMPELLDAIWGERLPPRGVGTLRTYVSRLRTLLEPSRPARTPARLLVSADDGYALRVPSSALDTAVFEARLAEAARLRGAGGTAAAHRELTGALALWGGTPSRACPARTPSASATASPNCGCPPGRTTSTAPSPWTATRRRSPRSGPSRRNTLYANEPRPS